MMWGVAYMHYKTMKRQADKPYYFGNTLAYDFCNLQDNEWARPHSTEDSCLDANYSILSVGCGDLRSLMYTISCLPEEYRGKLHFTMLDFDPFVMARNVLFVYMLVMYQDTPKIAESLATIWYSLNLTKEDYTLVKKALDALLQYDADSLKDATNGLITMETKDINLMRQVWCGWQVLHCDTSKSNAERLVRQRLDITDNLENVDCGWDTPRQHQASRGKWNANAMFAPPSVTRAQLTYDNPTLTGPAGNDAAHDPDYNVYTATRLIHDPRQPRDLMPFKYSVQVDHCPFFVWDYLEAKKHHYQDNVITLYHGYITHVINQTLDFVRAGRVTIKFTIKNFLQMKDKRKYDRVFTGVVADSYGVYTVLRKLRPFLSTANKHAVLSIDVCSWKGASQVLESDDVYSYLSCACKQLYKEEFPDATLPERPEDYLCHYIYDAYWFLRNLKAVYIATELANNPAFLDESDDEIKIPSSKTVMSCVGLRMRDPRKELNRVAPFRMVLRGREAGKPRPLRRVTEWYYAS